MNSLQEQRFFSMSLKAELNFPVATTRTLFSLVFLSTITNTSLVMIYFFCAFPVENKTVDSVSALGKISSKITPAPRNQAIHINRRQNIYSFDDKLLVYLLSI